MDQTRFQTVSNATQLHLLDQLEDAFDSSALEELDLNQGILTISTESGTFLLNKHEPSQQLWLASPISGGLHFSFDETEQHWMLPDGTLLYDLLRDELASYGVKVVL